VKIAVVGGGISGLAAAWELVIAANAEVTVLEPVRLGGCIQTASFRGHPVDTGPDAFIARVPDGVKLVRELGIEAELVAPSAGRALLWTGGGLRPLPEGLVLGAPARLGPLLTSRILTPVGIARAGLDLLLPSTVWPADPSVAELVTRRFGRQVAERLVDPLVGSIHAGDTRELSAAATVPQLGLAARHHRSLLVGLRRTAPSVPGPTFLAPRAGMGRLVERLTEALADKGVVFERTAATAIRSGNGGRAVVEPVGDFDGAVVATPAAVTAGLVNESASAVAAELAAIRTASVVLLTLAYASDELDIPKGVGGFLVPRSESRLMTACSFGSAKWPHWSDADTTILRVSAGRVNDGRAVELDDESLVDRLGAEVATALSMKAAPLAGRVSRWPGSFPQFEIGHLKRIERIEDELRRCLPAVAVAGSWLRGSGIPACIASGRRAAVTVASWR
jgi:oxygen-dependent protoporphyrinogen oxidase